MVEQQLGEAPALLPVIGLETNITAGIEDYHDYPVPHEEITSAALKEMLLAPNLIIP